MSNDKIIAEAVKLAQEVGRKEGFKVGDTVCHPSEEITCELQEIKGDRAVIGWEPKGVKLEVPLNELFDPKVAKRFCFQVIGACN